MIKSVTFAALFALTAAGAASASSGTEQLAASLGVSAADYTLPQLVDLKAAMEDGDQQRIAFILAHKEGKTNIAGDAQRAALLGVEAGKYTAAELTQLEIAKRKGDRELWNFITSGTNRAEVNGNGNPGKAQLAALLGVPADTPLSELTRLEGRQTEKNR